jgi:integrase
MNDVFLNKKKIKMFKGEYVKKVYRAYTYQEIKKMLDVSDLRAKVVILLMTSTGIRIGSIPALRLKHLEKINNIYKLTVYEGSTSQYFTFCSPETAYYIDAYLQYRTKNGESLTKDSFLIREQFDITDLEQIRKSKNMSIDGIESFLYIIVRKSGVRSVNHNRDRKEVALAHGFRKFFTTQCINAKINAEIREMLLGHKIGLASCYYRPTQEDFIQEYLKAVNLLTINEENRLKLKLEQKVQIEKSQIESLKADFEKFKNEVLKQRSKSHK